MWALQKVPKKRAVEIQSSKLWNYGLSKIKSEVGNKQNLGSNSSLKSDTMESKETASDLVTGIRKKRSRLQGQSS